jgi:hypothetical protein
LTDCCELGVIFSTVFDRERERERERGEEEEGDEEE